MAFTAEDGTGLSGANSYVDLEFAAAYFTDRGNAAWTGGDGVKQAALINATDYIEGRFARRFVGDMVSGTQGLSWPRNNAPDRTGVANYAEDEIPLTLKRATCEYAVRALTAALAPDPTVEASGVAVVTIRKKLGPLEKEFQVVGSGMPMLFKPYPAADVLIAPLLAPLSNRAIR